MRRQILGLIIAASLSGGLFMACSASNDELSAGDYTSSGGTGSTSSAGGDASVDVNLDDGGGPFARSFADFCGSACVPGTGESVSCDSGAGGSASSGSGGAGGSGGTVGSECQLAYDESSTADVKVSGTCGTPGMSGPNGSCFTASDCPAGFGCVDAGVCRPYCCDSFEACPAQTHCTLEEMAVDEYPDMTTPVPTIPVCTPVQDCTLLDDATCGADETCTIVRVDGTTSCVDIGEGELNEPCPCSAGYVCSTGKNSCLKLCRIDMASADCPSEAPKCQGGANIYPDGFGVCVEE
jgi:hypothetical protein